MSAAPPRPSRRGVSRLASLLVLLLTWAAGATPLAAESLHGGDAGLWLLAEGQGDDRGSTVLHTGAFPPPPSATPGTPETFGPPQPLRRTGSLRGEVTHAAAVGGGESLWVVFAGGGVQRMLPPRPGPSGRPGRGVSFVPSPALPAGHTPLAVAAAGSTLWVVAERAEQAEIEQQDALEHDAGGETGEAGGSPGVASASPPPRPRSGVVRVRRGAAEAPGSPRRGTRAWPLSGTIASCCSGSPAGAGSGTGSRAAER